MVTISYAKNAVSVKMGAWEWLAYELDGKGVITRSLSGRVKEATPYPTFADAVENVEITYYNLKKGTR